MTEREQTLERFDARSPGELLRKAREQQGLHIAALAAALKVTPRKLDALEGDRFDELPDATFTRALAQAVCRALKIDPKPVLELLPSNEARELEPPRVGPATPFRERPGRAAEGGMATTASPLLKPMVLGGVLLLLAAVALYWMPESLWQRAAPAPAATASAPISPLPMPASASVPGAAPVAADAASAAVVSFGAAASGAAVAPASPQPAAPAAASAETVFAAPATPTASEPAAATAGIVQLRSSEATWVEARDGRGQLLVKRTVLPGETLGLDGSLPIRMTIGNAAATQVAFRGQAIDLATRTKDNVARLELQ